MKRNLLHHALELGGLKQEAEAYPYEAMLLTPEAEGFVPKGEDSDLYLSALRFHQGDEVAARQLLHSINCSTLEVYRAEYTKRRAEMLRQELAEAQRQQALLEGASEEIFCLEDRLRALDYKTPYGRGAVQLSQLFERPYEREEVARMFYALLQAAVKRSTGSYEVVRYPEYERIIDWVMDNRQRGLYLLGNCGVGKSLICEDVLMPLLTLLTGRKLVHHTRAQDLYTFLNDYQSERGAYVYPEVLVVDDIGTSREVYYTDYRGMNYGRIDLLARLVDVAEKEGCLLIITSNLNSRQLQEAGHDLRTISRLRGLCRVLSFTSSGDLRNERERHQALTGPLS